MQCPPTLSRAKPSRSLRIDRARMAEWQGRESHKQLGRFNFPPPIHPPQPPHSLSPSRLGLTFSGNCSRVLDPSASDSRYFRIRTAAAAIDGYTYTLVRVWANKVLDGLGRTQRVVNHPYPCAALFHQRHISTAFNFRLLPTFLVLRLAYLRGSKITRGMCA